VVFENEARFYEETAPSSKVAYKIRVRNAIRGFTMVLLIGRYLNVLRHPFFYFHLWSRKVLRWLVAVPATGLLVTNCFLLEMPAFRVILAAQAAFYAFALLGGHIVMYDGLVSRLPNENALAMVLAHEIGHIKLRHPIVAMSRGLTVSLALGSFIGMTDNAFIGRIVEWIGYSSTLSYSRDQERAADAFASALLIEHYGHLNGAEDLFAAFQSAYNQSDSDAMVPTVEFLSTHPGLAERIEELRAQAQELGTSGTPIPLPWAD